MANKSRLSQISLSRVSRGNCVWITEINKIVRGCNKSPHVSHLLTRLASVLDILVCEVVVAEVERELAHVSEDAIVDERPKYVNSTHRDDLDGAADFLGCDIVAEEVDGVVEDEERWQENHGFEEEREPGHFNCCNFH